MRTLRVSHLLWQRTYGTLILDTPLLINHVWYNCRMKPVEYIDRSTGEKITESVMGDGALRFAYETLLGRTLWPVLFGSKAISAIMGWHYDSPRSRK